MYLSVFPFGAEGYVDLIVSVSEFTYVLYTYYDEEVTPLGQLGQPIRHRQ